MAGERLRVRHPHTPPHPELASGGQAYTSILALGSREGAHKGRGLANSPPAPAPPASNLDRLTVAGLQEGLVVRFDAEGHEGPCDDVPPVPARCYTLPALGNQGERRRVRSMLGTPTPGPPKRSSSQGREWTRTWLRRRPDARVRLGT